MSTAISALLQQEEGAFIVRDSNSFPGAFGLAVRASGGVRHFLIEPTAKGVRLRGCPDEPVFSTLSALVYQHTVTPLALPAALKLPDRYFFNTMKNTLKKTKFNSFVSFGNRTHGKCKTKFYHKSVTFKRFKITFRFI